MQGNRDGILGQPGPPLGLYSVLLCLALTLSQPPYPSVPHLEMRALGQTSGFTVWVFRRKTWKL